MKTSGDQLLDLLNELRIRLNTSGVERTVGLRDNMGNDCSFYSKSLDLFLKRDYLELKDLVEQVYSKFQEVK
jgi:hypothetical protein